MILMNDFKAEPVGMREEMLSAVNRVFESGWYVLGNEVTAFEKQWATMCGVEHGVGVGNGMDAIEIALRALNVGPGDEVITTSMTAFASVLAILRAGALPVFADIDSTTGLLSIESAERCVSARTKALVLVHLYGHLRHMSAWVDMCSRNKIELIEDCAQAHMATCHDGVAGSFGVAGAYSFYPTKNLGAPGDAGMLVTKFPEIAHRAAKLRNYGQSVRYHHPMLGLNSRLDEVHAAILSVRVKWLDLFTRRRQLIAAVYLAQIDHPAVDHLAHPEQVGAHVYHLFVIKCVKRNALQAHLNACGVQTLIHYPLPAHSQEPCKQFRRDPMGLRVSDRHASECLSLPCHPQMHEQDIHKVIEAVNSFKG